MNRQPWHLVAAGLLLWWVGLESAVAEHQPNVVVILTDDLGYGDLGCFGSSDVHTPRIDQMAAEGAKLTSFYMAAPYCTPSRAALMTGSYPKRVGMAGGVCLSADRRGLNPQEETMAEVLKAAGYRTGMFGKWHLGDQPAFLPTRQGFDEFFGLPYSHDIHPHNPKRKNFPPLPMLEGDKVIELEPDADFLTKRFTERAVTFIEENKDRPFFLYLPHPIPHRPNHMSEPFLKGVSEEVRKAIAQEKASGTINYEVRDKLYFRAVNEIDESVGQILDALKRHKLDEQTIVIFSSDNGQARPPVGIGSAKPLKGAKGMTWEGGLRVPTVIRWPGQIAAGNEIDEVMTAMDLLPTFANLAGAELPTDRVLDGKNIWPVLTKNAPSPHQAFFYYRSNSLQAVRSGKWKLHLGNARGHGSSKPALFDLNADIGETSNLLAQHPEAAKRLRSYITAFNQDLAKNSRPAGIVEHPTALTMPQTQAKHGPASTHPPLPPLPVQKGLFLDLNANLGIELEDKNRVKAWRNQVKGNAADVFVKQDKGRKVAGSGRPTLKKGAAQFGGNNTLVFEEQELLNMDEDAFDHMVTGSGYTWFSVMSVGKQRVGKKDVNSFFGNLKNGANYEGFWGNMMDDNRVWLGTRNGNRLKGKQTLWNEKQNPCVASPKPIEENRTYLIMGRMGAGQGVVDLELFINSSTPVDRKKVPVNPKANPSKMAVGQERDATNHPGHESFHGAIARFLIYERPLSDAELSQVIKQLSETYRVR